MPTQNKTIAISSTEFNDLYVLVKWYELTPIGVFSDGFYVELEEYVDEQLPQIQEVEDGSLFRTGLGFNEEDGTIFVQYFDNETEQDVIVKITFDLSL